MDQKAPDRALAHQMESAVLAAAQGALGTDLVKVRAEPEWLRQAAGAVERAAAARRQADESECPA